MADEIKKVEAPPQTPVEAVPDQKAVTPPTEEVKAGPTGLDGIKPEDLKKLYDRSPQMFKDAGIVPTEEKKVEPPPEKTEAPPPPPVSAAPKYGDVEIKLPEDVKVHREVVDRYLAHAKEIGLDAKQVQAEIDFQTKNAREEMAQQAQRPQPKVPTPEEIDAANVAKLKAKWGERYEENMEAARRAAVKFAGTKMLGKLTTSDPDLVEHFLTLANKDAEDVTPRGPNRTGSEGEPETTEGADDPQTTYLKSRYPHPSSQGMFKG